MCLEKRDEASINVLVMELLNDNQGTTKSLDVSHYMIAAKNSCRLIE